MFDRLIESEPESADFKDRRSYFMLSTVVVGVLFLAAVVVSIYASDYGLGNGSFELTELVAPMEMAAAAPEITEPRTPTSANSPTIETTRRILQATTSESTIAPEAISTVPNEYLSRTSGLVTLGERDTGPGIGSERATTNVTGGLGNGTNDDGNTATRDSIPDPPIKEPPPVKPPPVQSLGVINGRASKLPVPAYPATAKAVRAQGRVNVQVLIDENGRVISANAMNGHPMLQEPAEKAARNARFSPTYLSKVPVKVTGVIIYNFTL